MLKEFREFAMKGNVVDMAVGVMVGAAFGKIVTSMVTDIITPPLGLLMVKLDFSNIFISLNGQSYRTLAEAKEAGAATINLGLFINSIIDFLLVTFVLFLIIRQINRMRREPLAATLLTQECPYCVSTISARATRCPHCTAELGAAGGQA